MVKAGLVAAQAETRVPVRPLGRAAVAGDPATDRTGFVFNWHPGGTEKLSIFVIVLR